MKLKKLTALLLGVTMTVTMLAGSRRRRGLSMTW